jgi:hypothetical protein
MSALEPFEDGVEPFTARSAFAHREINHGQSETSFADSIQSNAGIPLCFLSRDGCDTSPRSKNTPSADIIVQSCGDCHLANFGIFASPERTDFRHQRFR